MNIENEYDDIPDEDWNDMVSPFLTRNQKLVVPPTAFVTVAKYVDPYI